MQTAHLQHSTKSINELLHQKRLKEALDALNAMVRETQNSALIDTLYNLEMTYKNLLHYTIEASATRSAKRFTTTWWPICSG